MTEQSRQNLDISCPGGRIEFMTSYWQLNTLYRGSTLNFSTNSLPDIKKADFGCPKNDFTSPLIISYDLQTLMNRFPCSAGKREGGRGGERGREEERDRETERGRQNIIC